MQVSVHNQQESIQWKEEWGYLIERVTDQTAWAEGLDAAVELSIILVDDAGIQEINRNYRGIDSPTDVISFALNDDIEDAMPIHPEAEWMLGDIYISLEKVLEQAKEYGHSVERELVFLTTHGMLHLIGYDHDTEQNRVEMRQKEEEILLALNLPR